MIVRGNGIVGALRSAVCVEISDKTRKNSRVSSISDSSVIRLEAAQQLTRFLLHNPTS